MLGSLLLREWVGNFIFCKGHHSVVLHFGRPQEGSLVWKSSMCVGLGNTVG